MFNLLDQMYFTVDISYDSIMVIAWTIAGDQFMTVKKFKEDGEEVFTIPKRTEIRDEGIDAYIDLMNTLVSLVRLLPNSLYLKARNNLAFSMKLVGTFKPRFVLRIEYVVEVTERCWRSTAVKITKKTLQEIMYSYVMDRMEN